MPSPSFCPPPSEQTQRELDASAQSFLDHLGLPTLHPLCSEVAATSLDDGELNVRSSSNDNHDDEERWKVGTGVVFELPNANNATTLQHTNLNTNNKQLPEPPSVGSISLLELHDHSYGELLVTATTMSAPTLAMAELWLRFFAVFLCPLCLCWMIQREISSTSIATSKKKNAPASKEQATIKGTTQNYGGEDNKLTFGIYIIGLASSAILFTDSLYVYEYGRWFGFSLFVLSSILSVRRCAISTASSESDKIIIEKSKNEKNKNEKNKGTEDNTCNNNEGMASIRTVFQSTVFLLIVTTTIVFLRSDGGIAMENALKSFFPSNNNLNQSSESSHNHSLLEQMPHPGIDLPTITEGLYHSSSNTLISSIVTNWPENSRTYNIANGATPYLVNGDQRTGIPFIVNKVKEQEYLRVWTVNKFDGEYLALDIAFPYSEDEAEGSEGSDNRRKFVHDLTKPVYLVLHGLNGGSHEAYVMDLVARRRAEGSTVIVFIARGMMDTSMVGWNMFHGARTGDVDTAARVVRSGLNSLADAKDVERRQILVGIGYSMGAIILSNYVARSGDHCALDAAMAVSGGLDMRQQLNFRRSMRLWQPMLTMGLRDDMLIGKYARHCKHRLTKDQFINMLRTTSISALDAQAIVTYNSFDDLVHYYTEMSAMGDLEPEFNLFGTTGPNSKGGGSQKKDWGRMANVSIPFAVLQALDDPLVGWRTIGTNDPQGLVDSGSGNVMLVLTKAGGHVGWPLGNNPAKDGWKWMSNAARDFALAVDISTKNI